MRTLGSLSICLVLLAAIPASARVFTVDPLGGGDYLTLPQAWGPAGPADTIMMMPGTHLVGLNQPGWPLTLDAGSPTVIGQAGAEQTILLGDGLLVAFKVPAGTGDAHISFQGLTFRSLGELFRRMDPWSAPGGGYLTFTDNVVEDCRSSYALDASSCSPTSVVARNVIRNNTGGGIFVYHNSGHFQDNEICFNAWGIRGACCENPIIQGNHIHHNLGLGIQTAVYVYTVLDNLIEYNGSEGIELGLASQIEGNVIRYNSVGVETYSTTAEFHRNDIYGNTVFNVQILGSRGRPWTWDCTMNWWGTTDPDAIAAGIWDCHDGSVGGCVVFDPWCEFPGCQVSAVAPATWSSIKAMYR
jgi:hypothetical protein